MESRNTLVHLIPQIMKQRTQLAVSMNRERDLAYLGGLFTVLLFAVNPILSVLSLTAVVYGVLAYRSSKKSFQEFSELTNIILPELMKQ